MDDKVYMKEDRLEICYDSGASMDGTVYENPFLVVARYDKKDMTIVNCFYDDEAVELYKKLTEHRRKDLNFKL